MRLKLPLEQGQTKVPDDSPQHSRCGTPPSKLIRRVMKLAFLAYLVYIGFDSVSNGDSLAIRLGQIRLGSLTDLKGWLLDLTLVGLFVIAQYFLLGCLLQIVYHLHKRQTENDLFSIRRWPVMLVGLGLATVLCGMQTRQFPGVFTLFLPCCGVLLGIWIASNCLRGFRTTVWLVPKLSLLAIGLAGLCGIGLYLATSDEPLAFEAPHVSADDKARLARLITSSEYLENGNDRLFFTETDLNLLMAEACEKLSSKSKARARLGGGTVSLDFSLAIPPGIPFGRYINSQGIYRTEIQNGTVAFRPLQLRIGRLHFPSLILRWLGDYAVTTATADDRASAVLASIDRVRFTNQQMEAVYHSKSLQRELKRAFHYHLGNDPELLAATTAHARHLVASATDLPFQDQTLPQYLHTAFTFAQQRSQQGNDPIIENRAAILAMSIVLGHRRMETFIGDVSDNRLKIEAGWVRGEVSLRGRRDWTRHFMVSAGLSLTFNSGLSDGAGLFKEEADSGQGGSGFSFSDLLADRAGVRFAIAATRDRQAAERMQDMLAIAFSIDDIFPPAADLPEGLSDAAFQEEFGGVDGEGYKQMLEKIERRLDTCRALANE